MLDEDDSLDSDQRNWCGKLDTKDREIIGRGHNHAIEQDAKQKQHKQIIPSWVTRIAQG